MFSNFPIIRMQATRKLAGKQGMDKALKARLEAELAEAEKKDEEGKEVVEEKKDDGVMRIFFDPPHYTVRILGEISSDVV